MWTINKGRGEQSIQTDPKMTQMLKLADKHFKAAIINMSKDLREKMVIMSAKLGITVEEWKMLKIEIVGQKITVQYLKLKNLLK